MLWITAIGACLVAILLWQWAMVAGLRFFAIKLPFSVAFHISPRREHELLDALEGRPKAIFLLISGVLLFALPLFVGLIAYDFVVDHSAMGTTAYALNHVVGSVLVFGGMCALGIWTSESSWNKYRHNSSART